MGGILEAYNTSTETAFRPRFLITAFGFSILTMHYRATDDVISLLWSSETASATNRQWIYLQRSVDQESNDEGRMLLSQAAENGHDAVVKLLLANDRVNMDAKDPAGRTPLWLAAGNRHEAVVKLLLMNDRVDVNAKDSARPLALVESGECCLRTNAAVAGSGEQARGSG